MNDEQIRHRFGRVAFEDLRVADQLKWNADLNERRFHLIDREIQGTLSQAEQLELAGLTQLMRDQVDSEMNQQVMFLTLPDGVLGYMIRFLWAVTYCNRRFSSDA